MGIPDLESKWLPPGRHPATLEEVQGRFVDGPQYQESKSRRAIWADFLLVTELLRASVKVHAAWIAGSFTTDKLSPADVDVVYIINSADRFLRSVPERQILESVGQKIWDDVRQCYVSANGTRVDAFVMGWSAHTGGFVTNEAYGAYLRQRGYWDDFWLRRRTGGKKDPFVPHDAHPRGGYLEVNLDDYS